MNFKILSIGKFSKDCQYKKIFEQFKKRIKKKVNLIEIKSCNLKRNKKIEFEKIKILEKLNKSDHVIVLDRSGEDMTSNEFANFFSKKMLNGCKQITFVIGGADGIDNELIESFRCFSFGNKTWPHLFTRLMLIEQIYRSFSIIDNHPYHK